MPAPKEKTKFALWVHPETMKAVKENYKQHGCSSQSEYIEKAIEFYTRYLLAEDHSEYLASAVKESLKPFEDRIATLTFKYAVELSMVMHILAAELDVDEYTLQRLRGRCVSLLKQSRGRVTFEEVLRYQRGG